MNVIQERLGRLRELMAEKGMDAYLVVTADFHESEYVGEFFKCRKFLTGFTGSAGTAVVTMDEACLWTDGRYFVQAAAQEELSLAPLPFLPMVQATALSITACLAATCIPLRKIAGMSIVGAIENLE